MGPGNRGSGHGRDAYHDADYPLRNPSPMTTELPVIEKRIELVEVEEMEPGLEEAKEDL